MSSDICPACNANLQGDEIPGEYFVHGDTHDDQVNRYGQCYCLPYGDRPPEDRFFRARSVSRSPAHTMESSTGTAQTVLQTGTVGP
jgi:ferredoxin-thioredoxin reductase catalytic subunit